MQSTKFRHKTFGLFITLCVLMLISSIITLGFIEPDVKIPTKWTLTGEAKQFVNPFLGLSIFPAMAFLLAFGLKRYKNWVPHDQNKQKNTFMIFGAVSVILIFCQGIIIWGAISQ